MKHFLRLTFVFLLISIRLISQDLSPAVINFGAENEQLSSVLDRLSANGHINITYNASDSALQIPVSYPQTRDSVKTILAKLLRQAHFTYEQVGNHVVILKSTQTGTSAYTPKTKPIPNQKTSKNALTDTIIQIVHVPVVRIDTIVLRDTVVKIETQLVYDTVFMEPVVSNKTKARKTVSLSRDVFQSEAERQNTWSLVVSASQMTAGYQILSDMGGNPELEKATKTESISMKNFGFGAAAQLNVNNIGLRAGLGISSFSHPFSYDQLISTGGFYNIDTVDVFYTVVGSDTTWTYVSDSSYVPLDQREIIFDRQNRIVFLELQLGIQYTFIRSNYFSFYVDAEMHLAKPLLVKGSSIENVAGYPAVDMNLASFNNWMAAYQAGIGLKYELSNWVDIYAEGFYKRFTAQDVANYPVQRRMHGGGFRIGIAYYL